MSPELAAATPLASHGESPQPLLHLDFPFTEHDSPALRERIGSDLARIVAGVRERDPHARAVILTGGFARGEGAALGGAPLNDYDLVVVRGTPLPRPETYARLGAALSEEVGIHVDLLPVWQGRLPRVGPKIFWYETRAAGRVLWGSPDLLLTEVPAFRSEELPLEEGTRLLFNRAAGLLLAYPGPGAPFEALTTLVQASKGMLACGESILVAEGKYHVSITERLRRLERLAALGHPGAVRALPHVTWATRFKLSPEAGASGVEPAAQWASARALVLDTVPGILAKGGHRGVPDYVRRAPAAFEETLVFALRSLRAHRPPFARRPSLALRHLTWRLLSAADPQTATEEGLREAARSAWFADAPPRGAWGDVKRAFFALRARTLQ